MDQLTYWLRKSMLLTTLQYTILIGIYCLCKYKLLYHQTFQNKHL